MLTRAKLVVIVGALGLSAFAASCTETNVHETEKAKSHACVDCHAEAYALVQTPPHEDDAGPIKPNTCETCHSTKYWSPSIGGGHPETAFPIMTGSHHNAAIGCTDCHLASLGANTAGQNTDCIHCHIGAHTIPSIDAVHAGVKDDAGNPYAPANPATPHSCLGCHPTG